LKPPFSLGIDAALNGFFDYAGKAYFFKDSHYVRYDWAQDKIDLGPKHLSAWNLPRDFCTGIDAAINAPANYVGAGNYYGKVWFFKGAEYVRYDWASNTIDVRAPLSRWGLNVAPVVGGGWTPPAATSFPSESMDPRVVKAPKTYPGNPPPPDGWKYWPTGKKISAKAKALADLGPKKEPGTFIQDKDGDELIGMRSEWHNFTVLFDETTKKPYQKPGLYHGGSLMVPIAQPAASAGAGVQR
jgi:hypothetical protein